MRRCRTCHAIRRSSSSSRSKTLGYGKKIVVWHDLTPRRRDSMTRRLHAAAPAVLVGPVDGRCSNRRARAPGVPARRADVPSAMTGDRLGRSGPRSRMSPPLRSLMGQLEMALACLAICATAAAQQPPMGEAIPRLRASRVAEPLRLDGRLDEPVWQQAEVLRQFTQVEPDAGQPAALTTEVRVAFDGRHLYIGWRAEEPMGRGGLRVQDLRRKFDYFQNDLVGIALDPLGDTRNAYNFQVTPYGSLRDLHVLDGSFYNRQWQAVWQARTDIQPAHWTAEIAIPWTALRYAAGTTRMRANFHRIARRTNEMSAWVPWPRAMNAYRMDFSGWIEGLEPPPPATAFAVRPYTTGTASRTEAGAQQRVDLGGEVLWQPTPATIVEGTVNTDFAQADVDRQVVNLRRFSVFFPEQRQFFLDTATLFDAGTSADLVVRPFFSRRIGLGPGGLPLRLDGGVRAVHTGLAGSAGVMAMHQAATSAAAASTFLVGRVNRNVGGTSRMGGLVTARRNEETGAAQTALTGAVDGLWRITPSWTLEGMASGTGQAGAGTGWAGYGKLQRQTSQLTASWLEALVTDRYAPAAGFVSRTGVALHAPSLLYDWRPRWLPARIRNLNLSLGSFVYQELGSGRLEESFTEGYIDVYGQRGSLFYPDLQHFTQRVSEAFEPVPGVRIAPGNYSYWRPNVYYGTDRSRRVWAGARLYTGGFYDRSLDQVELDLFVSPSPRAAFGLNADVNRFRGGGAASVVTRLIAPEMRLAWNPRLQLTAFYQYNDAARQGTLNARLSWEFRPLSFLYVVLNDARDAGRQTLPAPPRQQFLVKLVYFGQR